MTAFLAHALTACGPDNGAGEVHEAALPGGRLADLPFPVSNNAVAVSRSGDRTLLFSFLGLGPGKTWQDTRSDAWMLEPGPDTDMARIEAEPASISWKRLPDVPGPGGRLAATAVAVAGKVYVFGGYTVAEDGSEKSVPLVHGFDPEKLRYIERAPMPVPVDDAVSLVYADRYVYLVSGWHDTDNVDLVQVYDTVEDAWQRATPFPGPPVFGHAGGISGRKLLICDGVKVIPAEDGKRKFAASPECFLGEIDAERFDVIAWRRVVHHPGPALYRMGATGMPDGRIIFAGGSDNPYNFNGIGYDGVPSNPSDRVFAYDAKTDRWQALGRMARPSMDHRGLLALDRGYVLVGGMGEGQQVLPDTRLLYLD